jgi:signal transduction histidine kinase
MRQATASRLAWSLWMLNLLLLIAGVTMVLVGGTRPGDLVFGLLIPSLQLTSATVGAMIASRHGRNPIGWLFLGLALTWGVSDLGSGMASLAAGGVIPLSETVRRADWLGTWVYLPGIIFPVTFLFLLFPDGRLSSPRWRWVGILALLAVVLVTADAALAPGPADDAVVLGRNPYAVGDRAVWEVVSSAAWMAAILSIVLSAVALFLRFRRSSGEERERVKWLAYSSVMVALLFLISAIGFFTIGAAGGNVFAETVVLPAIILVAQLIIPVATGIAILKHRLFDVDIVINRAVLFAILATLITAVYVGIVVGVGALVGARGNLFLSIVATAVIAVGFQPLRARARRVADRLVYGKRAEPYELLSRFADRVSEAYSTEDVLPRMARLLGEGTGATRARIWLRVGSRLVPEASWPEDGDRPEAVELVGEGLPELPGEEAAFAVLDRSELLGALTVALRPGEALTATQEKLLADLASQAGLILRNVRLIEELRASRQRLVSAQDQERRRLERNIHDGAQQQLVALAVKLRLVETLAPKDAEKASAMAAQAKAELQEALDDLRDLARGIYPPLLADKGLAAALEGQIRRAAVPVTVEADGIGRYPQEAEAGVYFCVLEALQNVAKYAEASRASVRLSQEDGDLVLTVTDDGRGFDTATTPRGSGLQNMADRLDALGGSVQIESAPGRGTTVSGRIPVR